MCIRDRPGTTNPFPVTIPLFEPGCLDFVLTGYFSQIGYYCNEATMIVTDPAHPGTVTDEACIDILEGCPLVLSGSGDCAIDDEVQICLGLHTLITELGAIDFWLIYPNFMTPSAVGDLIPPSPYTFAGTSTISSPVPHPWIPGSNVVHVQLAFTSPLLNTMGVYFLFCAPFTITSTPTPGYNIFQVAAQGDLALPQTLNHIFLYDGTGTLIDEEGFLTQSANIILSLSLIHISEPTRPY